MTAEFHHPIPRSAPAIAPMFNIPLGQLDLGLTSILAGNRAYPFKRRVLGTTGAKTLSSDTLDVANLSFVTVTSETGTADNLTTLVNPVAGATYVLQAAAGHTITVKHGTGNIFLNSVQDIVLTGNAVLTLFYSPLGVATDTTIISQPNRDWAIIAPRTTIGSSVASFTISSIPSTYSHLLLVLELRTDVGATNDSILMRFNADATAANYYTQYVSINGAATFPGEALGSTSGVLMPCATGNTGSSGNGRALVWITNYASTTMRKAIQCQGYIHQANTSGNLRLSIAAGDWVDTSNAIASITLAPFAGTNVLANSAYELYGIE